MTFLLAGTFSLAAPTTAIIVLQSEIATAYPASSASFSLLALSFLGLAATIPTLGAAVVSGALADRYDRPRLLRWIGGISLATTVLVAWIFAAAPVANIAVPGPAGFTLPLWFLLALPFWAALMAAITIFRPAFNAALPNLVPTESLGRANGLILGLTVAVAALAQVVTGLLAARTNAETALFVPIVLFALAEYLLFRIGPQPNPPPRPHRSFLADAQQGYGYLGRRRELLAVTLASLAINFLSALAFVELAFYVRHDLAETAAFLGYLYAMATLGSGAGALLITRVRFERRLGRVLALLTLGMAVALLLLGVTRSPGIALFDMFLFGLFPGMFQIAFLAGVQATVPNELLGRVLAADEVGSLAFVPVGQYAGGTISYAIGIESTYLAAGGGMAVVGAALLFLPVVGLFRFDPRPASATVPPGATTDYPLAGPIVDPSEAVGRDPASPGPRRIA